jgi:PleD family two-component response regulator
MTSVTAANFEPAASPATRRRILVAEDSPTTQDILRLLLTQRGHDIDIANDGKQALNQHRLLGGDTRRRAVR